MTKLVMLMATLAACADEAPVAGLPCPCSSGYTCCADNLCVPAGDACSARETPPVSMGDRPCTATEDFEADGVIDMNLTYLYDGAGRLVRTDGTSPDAATHWIDTKTYDDAGHVTSDVATNNGTEVFRETSTYDRFGRLIEDDDEWPGNDGMSHDTWSYAGLAVTDDAVTSGVQFTHAYNEDATGKTISATSSSAGVVYAHSMFGYTAAGAKAFNEMDFTDGSIDRKDFTYDAFGHLTSVVGTKGYHVVITYDDQGRELTFRLTEDGDPQTDVIANHYCD